MPWTNGPGPQATIALIGIVLLFASIVWVFILKKRT